MPPWERVIELPPLQALQQEYATAAGVPLSAMAA
jgi:hypothetical protein